MTLNDKPIILISSKVRSVLHRRVDGWPLGAVCRGQGRSGSCRDESTQTHGVYRGTICVVAGTLKVRLSGTCGAVRDR
jgi:hypothetical protein